MLVLSVGVKGLLGEGEGVPDGYLDVTLRHSIGSDSRDVHSETPLRIVRIVMASRGAVGVDSVAAADSVKK